MNLPKRKQLRLKDYDYSQSGAYFVTICTQNQLQILSEICRGGALLLPIGEICKAQICKTEQRYNIKIEKYVIMPNHIHMIIFILKEREEQSPSHTLSNIICAFKSVTTKLSNENDNIVGRKIWQRSYHDHIIRNEHEYKKIWEYIETNPQKWEDDCYHAKSSFTS